jgi:hypothetical protein
MSSASPYYLSGLYLNELALPPPTEDLPTLQSGGHGYLILSLSLFLPSSVALSASFMADQCYYRWPPLLPAAPTVAAHVRERC